MSHTWLRLVRILFALTLIAAGCSAVQTPQARADIPPIVIKIVNVNPVPDWSLACQRTIKVGVVAESNYPTNFWEAFSAVNNTRFFPGRQVLPDTFVAKRASFHYTLTADAFEPYDVGTYTLKTYVYGAAGNEGHVAEETGTVTVPAEASFKDPGEACVVGHMTAAFTALGSGLGIAGALGCIPCAALSLGIGGGIAIVGGAWAAYRLLDPPEGDFTEIPPLTDPPFPALPAGKLTSEQLRLTEMFESKLSRLIGLARAMRLSAGRAWGAYEAGNSYWFVSQRQAEAKDAREAATELGGLQSLAAELQDALGLSKIAGDYSEEQVASLEAELGMGAPEITHLAHELGATPQEEEILKSYLGAEPLTALVGAPYATTLTHAAEHFPEAAAALLEVAAAAEAEVGLTATTESIESTTTDSTVMRGRVALHRESPVACYFEWGSTTMYGHTAQCEGESWRSARETTGVQATVGPLTGGCEYHYRLVVVGHLGTTRTNDQAFQAQGECAVRGSPVLSQLRVHPTTIAASSKNARHLAAKATIAYLDSEAATLVLTIQRELPGIRVGHTCAAPGTHKRSRKHSCIRFRSAAVTTHSDQPGHNEFEISRRVNGHTLPLGTYRLALIAHNSARQTSSTLTATLKIVR